VGIGVSIGTGVTAFSDGFAPWVGAEVHPLNPISTPTANAAMTLPGMPAHVP
jgi:hypothetical protein